MVEMMECMKDEPLLSVIVPIYNVEPYIRRCLDSIINQSYTNLEIICVDDGSLDRSGEIADEYAILDSRIVVLHKNNGGLVSARKAGAQIAKGTYIANIDSDDWIEPDMFKETISFALQHKADVVTTQEIRDYGDYSIKIVPVIDEGVYVGKKIIELKEKLIDLDFFFKYNISGHICDKIFTAQKYKEIQRLVPNEISKGEDTVVAFPLLFEASTIYVSNRHYYHYCLRADSIMGKASSNMDNAFSCYESYVRDVFNKFGHEVKTASAQAELLILYNNLFENIDRIVFYDKVKNVLFPYGTVKTDGKVAIYGSGKYGVRLYNHLKGTGWFNNLEWYDTEGKNGAKRIDENIKEFDTIIIGAILVDTVVAIKEELHRYGVEENRIISLMCSKLIREFSRQS